MAVKFVRKPSDYISESAYMYDVARNSKYFDKSVYDELVNSGNEELKEQYLYGVAGAVNKTPAASFNQRDYDYLSAEDKASYFLTTMYEDPNNENYKQAMQYFGYKIDEAVAQETYNSLNGFEKTMASVGGIFGNAVNELVLGTVEGLWDLTTFSAEGLAHLFQQEDAAEAIRAVTKQDTFGVQANREALAEYAKKYTYLDKNKIWSTANQVVTSMAQMVPLFVPGGSLIYFGSMAGNTASEIIRTNEDIDYLALLGYTAAVTGVEIATEKVSSLLFGGSFIDNLVFGKTGTKTAGRSWIKQIGLDFLSEGFEESIAEFADTVIYNAIIGYNTGEFKAVSMTDILYAGLIGGLIGGIMGGGRLAGTRALSVTTDGQLIDTKLAQKSNIKTSVDFTKAQTMSIQEKLQQAIRLTQTDALADLQHKYSGERLDVIKTKHADEYKKAQNTNKKIAREMSEVVLGLAKIHELAGDVQFAKAMRLVEKTYEKQQSLLSNYTSKSTGNTQQARLVEQKANDKLSRQTGAKISFTLKTDLTAQQMRLKQALKNYYGVDVYFGNIGTPDGVVRKFGMTISDHEIILDTEQFGQMSEQEILNKMVKEELVHNLQFLRDIITPETLNAVRLAMNQEQYTKMRLENMKQPLDPAYAEADTLTKVSEVQAKALAEVLLFDEVTVSKMFYTEYSTLNKVYKFFRDIKTKLEESKELRKQKNKIKYNTILKSMKMYRDVAAKKLGSADNVNQFIKDFKLTQQQADDLVKTYLDNPSVEPLKNYIELAFSKANNIRKKLANDYGVTNYVKAGFTEEFSDALIYGELVYNDIYKFIADDTVGTPEATNMILDILIPMTKGTFNKHTGSYEKIKILLDDGLSKAVAYARAHKTTISEADKSKPLSYAIVNEWATANPEEYRKYLSDKPDKYNPDKPDETQTNKFSEGFAAYDKAALVRKLIEDDFDYSFDQSRKMWSILTGRYAKKSKETAASQFEKTDTTGDVVGKEIFVDEESNPEEILLAREEAGDSVDFEIDDSRRDFLALTKKKLENDLATKPAFQVVNEWRNRRFEIQQALGENGKQIWKKEILPLLPPEKSSYSHRISRRLSEIKLLKRSLTETEKQFADEKYAKDLLTTAEPEQLDAYIDVLDEIITAKPEQQTAIEEKQENTIAVKETQQKSKKVAEGQLEFDLPITPKEAFKQEREKRIKEGKSVTQTDEWRQTNIFDVLDEDTTLAERIEIQEKAKQQRKPVHEIRLKDNQRMFVENLKSLLTETNESQYQGDITNHDYDIASNEFYQEHADLFSSVTADDYHAIKLMLETDASKSGRTALNLFMRYAYNHRGSQFKTISELVKSDYAIRASESAQFLGLMSNDYGNHSVRAFVTELSLKNGVEIKLPEELLLSTTSKKYKNIDDFRNDITNDIQKLTTARKSETDAYKKWLITNEISQKEQTLSLLEDNDIAGAIDNQITAALESNENVSENLDLVNQITEGVVKWIIEHAQFGPSGFTGFSKNKIPMSQNMEKVKKFFTTLNSFRYLMMLSNPATALKNGVSNTLNLGSAMVEDVVLKGYENSNILSNEASQVHYTGEYDDGFKEFVNDMFLDKVKAEAEGDKYTTSQIRKLQQKYAEENDPIKKSKFLSQIQKLERKMLSDKWWVTKRTMQNLTNTLAGSSKLILRDVTSRLNTMYKGKQELALVDRIRKTNPELATTYENALRGDKKAIVKLALDLKLDIVSTDLKKSNSIYYHALRRSNETFLKVDNWYTKMKNKLGKEHPAAVYVLDQIIPFARVSINAMSYIFDRSPVGLVKGLIQKFQTQARWDYQRKDAVLNYYKRKYVEVESKNNNDFKFSEPKFQQWLSDCGDANIKKALAGDSKLLRQIHKDMVDKGWINSDIGFDNIYARADVMEQLAKGSVGTALMTLGVILAAVTDAFEYDDDDDYLGPVINFGGLKIGLDELSPFSTMFSVGAMLKSDNVDDKLGAAFNVIADATILSTLDSAMTYSDGLWDYFKNLPTNLLSQYQPAITKQINKIAWNRKKDKSSSNYGMKLVKSLAANSLIFSWLLPDKINPYTGKPEKYYDTGRWEALFDVVLPVGLRFVAKSDFEKEAERVGAPTTGMSGNFTINGSDITLKGNAKEKYARYKADYLHKQFNRIINGDEFVTIKDNTTNKYKTTTYENLTDAEKQRVLKNMYTNATEVTKIQYWLDQGNSYYVTSKEQYSEYKRLFGSSSKIVYKKSWDGSKFVEG